MIIYIDFETYYAADFTLSKLTTSEYIRDPRFEVIGVGVQVDDGEPVWLEADEFRHWAREINWARATVVAHNAPFDGAIATWHFGIRPKRWACTLSNHAAMYSRAEAGGSLAKLAEFYQVGKKGDEVLKALGMRRADFTPERWLAYGEYCKNDVRLAAGIYKKQVAVLPEVELAGVDFTIRMFTEPQLFIDDALLAKAAAEETQRKAALLASAAASREILMSNEKFAVLLAERGVDPPRKISLKTEKETWAFAKSDPGMKALLASEDDEVRWLAEARVGVKSTMVESRIARFRKLGEGGQPAPVFLKYAAAHTQRWGGGDKTNFQNLNRGGVLRQALLAPEGYVIVAVDSGQIEARGAAWLTGNEGLLDAFRAGRDVYCEFATEAYGRPITAEEKTERFVGKVCVLGLGYGMGWRKLAATLLAGALGGKPVRFLAEDAEKFGVDVGGFAAQHQPELEEFPTTLAPEQLAPHAAVAHYLVHKYRALNAPTRDFWYFLDRVIAAMDGRQPLLASFGPGAGDKFEIGRHFIKRPAGLCLKYPGLSERHEEWGYLGGPSGKERKKLYGGMLLENLVQAFCRDIILEQVVRLHRKYGYRPVTLTHDETVFCVPEGHAETALARALEEFKTPPDWCATLPLAAEGGFGYTYAEAK